MRQVFLTVKTVKEARDIAPWACRYVRVSGGWICFESSEDFNTWVDQT